MTDFVHTGRRSPRLATRPIASLSASVVLAFPAVAAACPDCAGSPDASIVPVIVIGAFVTLPFLLAWGVVRLARRGETVDVLTPRPGRGLR